MATTQLNCRVPVALANRLREAATARHTTTGALVAQAIEALLASDSASPTTAFSESSAALAVQLAVIEQRLQILEQLSPVPEQPLSLSSEALPLPERRLTAAEAEGLLTTPAVAKALGLASPSALTNWIGRQQGNGIGAVYRGYRLRGKGLLPAGMSAGWLWQAADLPHN